MFSNGPRNNLIFIHFFGVSLNSQKFNPIIHKLGFYERNNNKNNIINDNINSKSMI